MSLWTSLDNYSLVRLGREGKCANSRCHKYHATGASVLFRKYPNPHNRNQAIRHIFCNEDCWRTWEVDFWENRANEKSRKEKFDRLLRLHEVARSEGYGHSAGIVSTEREKTLEGLEYEEEREAMRNFEI